MEWLETLKHSVPLLQTLVWAGVILATVFLFKGQLKSVVNAVQARVERGSAVSIGPSGIRLGELRDLERVAPQPVSSGDKREAASWKEEDGNRTSKLPNTPNEWNQYRNHIYNKNRGIFLTHALEPSSTKGQDWDIFIYLMRHKSTDLSDVEKAEFYLGSHWGNKIFEEINKGKTLGIATSAYGTFLCCCLVTFRDGYKVYLDRYIDFEMGEALFVQPKATR